MNENHLLQVLIVCVCIIIYTHTHTYRALSIYAALHKYMVHSNQSLASGSLQSKVTNPHKHILGPT